MKSHQHRIIISSYLILSVAILLSACITEAKKEINIPAGPATLQLGEQAWMVGNYEGVTFRNGDSIPNVRTVAGWDSAAKAGQPAWCYYNNDPEAGEQYGRIYNWYAINDARGFAPRGWHVPSNDEWIQLENFFGVSLAGMKMRCTNKAVPMNHKQDSTGFCARLGGYRGKEGGFSGVEEFTYFASSSERDLKDNDAWGRGLNATDSSVMRCGLFKGHGVYVRLIKDQPAL